MAANPNTLIADAAGLQTQPNELTLPAGALAVAKNMEITRDGIAEVTRGYANFSSNLPAFTPQQLLVVGGVAYLNLDSGLWYYDTTSSRWLRKRGDFGGKLLSPLGITVTGGFCYVLATSVIYRVNLTTGTREVFAGRYGVTGSADGVADAARFNANGASTTGITNDSNNLYLADATNQTIRRVEITTRNVTTIAGTAGASGTADGTGATARFNLPGGIYYDGASLFVSDSVSCTVRKIAPPLTAGAGVVTTIAGSVGTADGTGVAAGFSSPGAITGDGTNLYLADYNNNSIRKIAPPLTAGAGVVTTIAGSSPSNGSSDGTGTVARFYQPTGIALIGGSLYVTDNGNSTIRKISPPLTVGAGIVTTLAGSVGVSGNIDEVGTAARLSAPGAMATDGADVFFSDPGNFSLRKMYVATAYVTTLTGSAGIASAQTPTGIADGIVTGPT